MALKHVGLIGILFVTCLAGYLTLRTCRLTSDPASSMSGFVLFRAHYPMPAPTVASPTDDPTPALGHLHLLQANVPF
jgi:hypothetical protein